MRLTLEVRRGDGPPEKLGTRPADLVAWEAHAGRSLSSWQDTPPSYTDLAFLCWRADTHGQQPRQPFAEWLDSTTITELTLVGADAVDPTQQAATGAG